MIQYDFDLLECRPPSVKPAKKIKATKKANKKKSNKKKSGKVTGGQSIKVGDVVYITGICYHNAQGKSPHSKKFTHKKMTVTKTSATGSHPIHLGTVGWAKISDLSWS